MWKKAHQGLALISARVCQAEVQTTTLWRWVLEAKEISLTRNFQPTKAIKDTIITKINNFQQKNTF